MERDANAAVDLRDVAKNSIEKKRHAWRLFLRTALLNAGLTVIWFMTGGGYFWPGWVMLGTGIGVVRSFIDAYMPSNRPQITDADIDAEIERLKKSGRI